MVGSNTSLGGIIMFCFHSRILPPTFSLWQVQLALISRKEAELLFLNKSGNRWGGYMATTITYDIWEMLSSFGKASWIALAKPVYFVFPNPTVSDEGPPVVALFT